MSRFTDILSTDLPRLSRFEATRPAIPRIFCTMHAPYLLRNQGRLALFLSSPTTKPQMTNPRIAVTAPSCLDPEFKVVLWETQFQIPDERINIRTSTSSERVGSRKDCGTVGYNIPFE